MARFRFERDFRIVVGLESGPIEIKPPFGVTFDGDKAIDGFGLNKLKLTISNLSETNRLALVKDPEQNKRIPIIFEVGFLGDLEKIYQGTVHRGVVVRNGPKIDVSLECIDGGYDAQRSFTAQTVKGRALAIQKVVGDMTNTTVGKITDISDTTRPHVMVGASYDQLFTLLEDGEELFIDNEKVYIIKSDEVVSSFIPRVSVETGLINSPEREQSIVTFETMLNPSIRVGGLCNLISELSPHLNGVYKVQRINYSGDYYGDDWKQSVRVKRVPNYKVL